MTPAQLSPIFFLELAIIIGSARGLGWLVKRFFGQSPVVGEMIAGVVLGPSLFGLIAPGLQSALFPKAAISALYVCAQLGVGLYMFVVGLDFRRDLFRANGRSAAAVSLSGMGAPVLAAVAITPWLQRIPGLFGPGVTSLQATLFMSAAIAITAFPMLARIIHERGLSGTPMGTLSLSAGAVDDAAAWTVLAVVLASLGGSPGAAVVTIAGGAGFAVLALAFGSRLLAPLGRIAALQGVSPTLLGMVLALFAVTAAAMDLIGIHAVFGGFILGAAMPKGVFAEEVKRRIEPFTVVVLLPLFFTFSGLNTRLTAVNSLGLVGITVGLIAVSVLAKGGACYLAARLGGQDHRTALGIGALMNARGLMELIIINIGLQRHVIGPALFSMLVLMAIVTTLMATPLFEAAYGRQARRRGELGGLEAGASSDRPG